MNMDNLTVLEYQIFKTIRSLDQETTTTRFLISA